MSDNEIRTILIERKKAELRKIEKEVRNDMNREIVKGLAILPGLISLFYLVASIPV